MFNGPEENPVIKVFEQMEIGSPVEQRQAKRPLVRESYNPEEEVKEEHSGDHEMRSASPPKQ